MASITLQVGHEAYEGWTSVSVQRRLDALSGAFQFSVSDRWSERMAGWPIVPGSRASVSVAGKTVITGYVDRLSSSFSASSRTIEIAGRDRAGDLVDCSVDGKNEYKNVSIYVLAQLLCSPFGIPVTMLASPGALFPVWTIQQGETVYETLERAGRQRGFLFLSDGRGGIMITTVGILPAVTGLEEGANILEGSVDFDDKDRFKAYTVLGQGAGDDSHNGALALQVKGTASDEGVGRYRPKVIIAEGQVTQMVAKRRAEWEATVRAARAATVRVTVQGWSQRPGGPLWDVNLVVPVKSRRLGLDGAMLIVGVTYTHSLDGGEVTALELARPDAFKPKPSVPAREDPAQGLGKGLGLWG